ncbi:MAG: TolC family protein [Terracidiphilus sp.]|jgi:HAE1 family hydrophobic/amphiphilic exporter-1
MKFIRFCLVLLFVLVALLPLHAQSPESYRGMMTARVRADKLPPPQHLKNYVQNGKISLGLRDTILLTLENNSNVQIEETQIETQKFNLLGQFQPFDPIVQSSLNINRYSSPSYSQLQGVGISGNATLNSLTQVGQIGYTQTFTPGTNINASIQTSKFSTNSSYNYLNPYFDSTLNFAFTQPLLRGGGRFANTALVKIARRSLAQSRSNFEAQVNDAIQQVVDQYWSVVQARGALDVEQKSMKLAEASYARDKRSLELGALPPLDIYRSQSEVAARKVEVIQAAYALTQAEEALRLTIGADRDPQLRAMELELTEKPETTGELETIDAETALAKALSQRPELDAIKDAMANDETSIRLAHNQLEPNLSLQGFYQSSGLGGNQYNLITGAMVAPGGFGSSMGQLFGFGYPGYGASLSLSLPVRNRGAQATLGNALVSRTRDLYNGGQVQEQITREVRNAVFQLEESRDALAAGSASFELAQKTLAAEQRKFELGAETNYFVLDAQTRLASAELILLQTQVNYRIALATVGHSTGDLLSPYHVQIAELSK